MSQGWISLHRKIMEHPFYLEKRKFSKFEAWVDLLLLANHKDSKVMLGNEMIYVEKGSFITSELKLMERWGWSKTKVRNFLDLLEKDNMIVKKTDRKKTTISIVNYCVYQDSETTKKPQKDHEETTRRPQKDTNNNDNNENNENKNIKNMSSKELDSIPYKEIVDYLNQKANTNYRHTTKKTRQLIQARWKEDFRLEDFKKVIDNKTSQWLNDPKMNKYLRPETLFGTKFESYLNERVVTNGRNQQVIGQTRSTVNLGF